MREAASAQAQPASPSPWHVLYFLPPGIRPAPHGAGRVPHPPRKRHPEETVTLTETGASRDGYQEMETARPAVASTSCGSEPSTFMVQSPLVPPQHPTKANLLPSGE